MMKDSYSFDMDPSGLDHSYKLHYEAYQRIFDRCGIDYKIVGASSGAMGGSESEEFVVFSEAGEDWIVHCRDCGYAANLECAQAGLDTTDDQPSDDGPEQVHTPGQKTIQEVSEFLSVPKSQQIKSLVVASESGLHLIMLRGDHQLSEAKLAGVLQTDSFRPGENDEIRSAFGASPGSLGPVGVKNIRLLADNALKNRRNLVCGANQDDYHLRGVTPEIDFQPEWADLREIQSGDSCVNCSGPLEVQKAIELGHIFKLGKRYSETMGATVLGQDGSETHLFMGSYGIGIERILAAAAESYHDELGLVWPRAISPFQVIVTLLRPDDPEHRAVAEDYYSRMQNRRVDCLLDDRDERPGVKFKDAELIGIPVRITLGKKLASGQVELFDRLRRESITVASEQAVDAALEMLDSYSL
jgi:prolyl-tRNA synthetase